MEYSILKKLMKSVIDKGEEASTCLSRKVGAFVMGSNGITSFGFCGAPSSIQPCFVTGCLRKGVASGTQLDKCKSVHAEQRAIIEALKKGANLQEGMIIVSHKPCVTCAKLIIETGIKKVIYYYDYPSELTDSLFKQAGVVVERLSLEEEVIKNECTQKANHGDDIRTNQIHRK